MSHRLRIALNLHFLRPEVTGGGETYAVELVRALAEIDRTNEYMLFCNSGHHRLRLPQQENFKVITSQVSASIRPLRYAWEQLVMPVQLRTHEPNLVHSMGYVCPLLSRLKQVVTVPDANWKDLGTMSPAKREALGFFVRRSAAAAEVVITGTRSAATTLERHLPSRHGRILVVPLGADHLPTPVSAQVAGLAPPYVLGLSGSLIHKNIPRLIQAFERIAHEVPHQLVIAGNLPKEVRMIVSASSAVGRITLTGYVSDEKLASLYAGADLFVFPSWHEGFGLPLIEAQHVGTPVAAAAIPALVEISDGSSELFEPFSIDSMTAAMLRVLKSPARRADLAAAARANAARYTWQATARATIEIYEAVAGSPRRASWSA
jgi:glycosyltransferase involved in cell wall biosynthesis